MRRTAFAKPYVWWVKDPLDLDAMRAAASALTGFGDFRAFTDADPDEQSTRVLVDDVTVARDGALLLVRVVGSHFLWKMVRRLVGTLVEAGRGNLDLPAVHALLDEKSRRPAEWTAPPSGLFLESVKYRSKRR